jgi:hypothetical protein
MQTFVVGGKKTSILFAPHMSHSIMKDGRKCGECHGAEILQQIESGEVNLIWIENGNTMNLKSTIPVVDGVNYKCVYQDRINNSWVPIDHPDEPLKQYAGFGEPLTKAQLNKLIKIKAK